MKPYFYHNTTKLITTCVLDLFNDIVVKHYDTSANEVASYAVPVSFGMEGKPYLSRKVQESGKKYFQQGTKIGIVFQGYSYDPDRDISSNTFVYYKDDNLINEFYNQINPIPVNYKFNIKIHSTYIDVLTQILEQIVPYFRPQINFRVKEFPFLNIERDIKVILGEDYPIDYTEPLTNEDRRELTSEFSLVAHGFMYRPIATEKIVKVIKSKYFCNDILDMAYDTSAVNTSADIPINDLETYYDTVIEKYIVKVVGDGI